MVDSAVHIVLAIFLMLGAGMLLYKIRWITDGNIGLISRLVVKLAFPAMIVYNMFNNFSRDSLTGLLGNLAAPYLSILICMPVSFLCLWIARIPKGRKGVFTACFLFSNSVFIGVPVSTALFGDGVMPYTLMYYIANTSLFWSLAVFLMEKDAPSEAAGPRSDWKGIPAYWSARLRRLPGAKTDARYEGSRLALKKLMRVIPLPLIAFVICFVLVLLGVTPPQFILNTGKYIGNMVTPLSLIYTGAVIMRMIMGKRIRWQKGYLFVLMGRFILAPALMALLAGLFHMDDLMKNALIMQAAMPVMASTPIAASEVGSDEEYAAGIMALSTFLSLAVIPLYAMIL